MESLSAVPTLCRVPLDPLPPDLVVVSPDVGRVPKATEFARCLDVPLVVLHKRRESGVETQVTHVVGDVSGRACLIVDDMIATGETLAETIRVLLEAGARPDISVAATHGLLLPGAREKLCHPAVRGVWVTDTVDVDPKDWPHLHVVSIAPVIASAIERLAGASVADLH